MASDNRFGRLTVVSESIGVSGNRRRMLCLVRCDCGNELTIKKNALKTGNTKSCGCLQRELASERLKTHGRTESKTYESWCCMIARCTNKNRNDYSRYGGAGIKVCGRWLNSFENFLADMGDRPDGMTIDRKDNSKGYFPGNCRWSTVKEQSRNTKRNVMITHGERTMCVIDWATELGMSHKALRARLKREWSVADALTTPIKKLV